MRVTNKKDHPGSSNHGWMRSYTKCWVPPPLNKKDSGPYKLLPRWGEYSREVFTAYNRD